MRKTKIICTLGPASDDEELFKKMIQNGLDCARLNFSHGTHEEQLVRVNRIRKVRDELNIPLPMLLDTKGPEIRVGNFKNNKESLVTGEHFTLFADHSKEGTIDGAGLTYPNLADFLNINDVILVDDGKIELAVEEVRGRDLYCIIKNDGVISNHKSINIPNVIVDMPYLSETDKKDLAFGVRECVDYVAASFVRRKQDVIDLKEFLASCGNNGDRIKVIAKIENTEGVKNMDDIIATADGVMVARGDLGVEVPFKLLPHYQKQMIEKCYRAGKIVVTATQMLDSMQENPRPTRAEVSDVANAVYDGTVGIMLSGESAAGKYPLESVTAMKDIALASESDLNHEEVFYRHNLDLGEDTPSVIANSAVKASFQSNVKAIICVTYHGYTAFKISSYRPQCPIIAVCVDEKACRQLNLAYNVRPIYAEKKTTTDELFLYAIEKALETGLVKKGDKVIITTGSAIGDCGTDTMKLHRI